MAVINPPSGSIQDAAAAGAAAGATAGATAAEAAVTVKTEVIGIKEISDHPGYSYVSHDDAGNILETVSTDGREIVAGGFRHDTNDDGDLRLESWKTGNGLTFNGDQTITFDENTNAPDGITVITDVDGFVLTTDRRDGIVDSWRVNSFNVAKPCIIQTRRPLNRALSAIPADSTIHTTWVLESDYTAVQLVYENDAAASFPVTKAFIGSSSGANTAGGHQPLDASGSVTTFTPVTFNSAGLDVGLPAPLGSLLTVTVPGITSPQVKNYAVSDWMRIPSIAPVGSDSHLRYLMTRTYFSAAARGVRYGGMDTAVSSPFSAGRIGKGLLFTGDVTSGALPAHVTSGWTCPAAIRFYGEGLGATLLPIGDSISQGTGSVGDVCSWGHLSTVQVSKRGTPVSYCGGGWGGQNTAGSYARGKQEINLLKPKVVTINTFSPNDGVPTAANIELAFSRAYELAEYAYSVGCVPVLLTPIPWITLTAETDALRKITVERVRRLGREGRMLVLDMDAIVTDGANPARILTQYNADGTHLNDAGNRAVARHFVPILIQALGL